MEIAEIKIKSSLILFTIILVNAIGVLLRYLNLDCYFIFFGFRFYLSLFLPLIIIFRSTLFPKLKEILIRPKYNETFQPLGWIFLPLILVLLVLYFTKKIEIGDPDYFYEFGLSSIFDFPIYLIWNLPQLLMFFTFLFFIQSTFNSQFRYTFFIILFLFAYEFVPLDKSKFDIIGLLSLLLMSASLSFLIKYFQNIYWISIFTFTVLWGGLLAFGSNSKIMIHLLFAAQYQSWDGFFEVAKNWGSYLLPTQLAFTLIFISITILIKKSNK